MILARGCRLSLRSADLTGEPGYRPCSMREPFRAGCRVIQFLRMEGMAILVVSYATQAGSIPASATS